MDQQFKKILQKTKAWNQGVDPLSRTFAGALFKESSWPFHFNELPQTTSLETSAPAAKTAPHIAPSTKAHSSALSQVLFVGDTYSQEKGEDLLGKMIAAMKLTKGEFNRVLFDESLEDIFDLSGNLLTPGPATLDLFNAIKKYKPAVVVTLGATVTNILLGKREKLSGIHGQFFEKTVAIEDGSHQYSIMPIFHPDFLMINPNMKRTAWIDLQKVMERIGKI
jgi:hypothetical protein